MGMERQPTLTAREYRQHAREYLELAKAANDHFARVAMMELAQEYNYAAWKLERALQENEARSQPANPLKPPHLQKTAA
jgi:hypothetical protein